jgi:polyribonucleotide nucleotidyltransferase
MRYEEYKTFRTAVGGKLLQLEIGKVCEQANGQVMVKYGDTVVNVTAVMNKSPRPDIDFFPLSCDYEEKMYAAGKIPGGFIKRESRPSEKAILNCRLMDRPLRPLFQKGFTMMCRLSRLL